MLPPPPRRIDTAKIQQKLRELGHQVHRRTIQRDLVQLSRIFPLVAEERNKPFGWRWADSARAPELPVAGVHAYAGAELLVRLRVHSGKPHMAVDELGGRDPQTEGGSGNVTVTLDDVPRTRRALLGLADRVEVLAPPSLRREIAALAEQASRVYGRAARDV
jgi:predicted DNA-binding transcriptional regulator YafY